MSSDEFITLEPLIGTNSSFEAFGSSSSPWLTYGANYIGPRCTGSNDVNQCISLTRISMILEYHKEWIDQHITAQTKEEEEEKTDSNTNANSMHMYGFINNVFDKENGYSNVELINDYHHLIDNHSHQFQDIYNRIIKQCDTDLTTSYFIKRHYRQKMDFNKQQDNALYFISATDKNTESNTKETCIQQILDTISCYFLHSFDIGYILSTEVYKKEIKDMNKETGTDEKTQESKKTVSKSLVFKSFGRASFSKKAVYKKEKEIEEMVHIFNWIDKNRNAMQRNSNITKEVYQQMYKTNNNKYNSIIRHRNDNQHQNEQKYDDDVDGKQIKLEFGHRYYYTQNWKNNSGDDIYNIGSKYKEWYISARYVSLKEESVSIFSLCPIDIQQWNQIFEKANNYLLCDICKKIKAENGFKDYKSGSIITIHHLIAVLLYTNFEHIEYELNATYHKIPFNSETDEHLKQRHAHLANLGRYLSESVQCFGKKTGFSKKVEYYHIINKSVYMPMSICYNAPLSVTTSKYVAMNALYSYNKNENKNSDGLLLEIGGKSTKHFDMKWFSDTINESEIIFCHCKKAITVQNVIDIGLGINYHLYLCTFGILNNMLNGSDFNTKTRGMHFEVDMKKTINPIYSFLHHKFYGKHNEFALKNNNNESLPIYVEQILNAYFNNLTEIEISWKQISKSKRKVTGFGKKNTFNIKILSLIQPFICYYNIEWIKWHLFVNAFTNLQCITIQYIKLTSGVFEDLLFHIKNLSLNNNRYQHYKLKKIILKNLKTYKLSFVDAKSRYNERFAKLKWEFVNPTFHVFEIRRMNQT